MKIIFGLIGLYLGGLVAEWEGAIFGCLMGILSGAYLQLKQSIQTLDEQLKTIRTNLIDSKIEVSDPATENIPSAQPQTGLKVTESTKAPDDDSWREEETVDIGLHSNIEGVTSYHEETVTSQQESPISSSLGKIFNYIKEFFTTGNIVAKVGVIILIFGASFLVNYAVERNVFPLEYRLVAIAVASVIMFITGWRLRKVKPGIALVLQGGGVGLLYLVVFAAAKPSVFSETNSAIILPEYAFIIMFFIIMFSGAMAVIQNSRVLAILGTIGGFLAPILTSTGQGSHVILFSYYAFLNAGIFGIAWYRSWRGLNWLGFIFTFVIASIWGYKYYQPDYFNTTEPFLILFYLFYVAIAVLFALRQPPNLKGLVDGSLVFGVPLVGFTLQSGLVEDIQYGQAWSALALCIIYTALTKVFWQKHSLKMLAESFLALAVIFGSLVIPFTFDGHWTAAAWALEGAGIAWVGIRQGRLLARIFGLLLQFGGAIAFLSGTETFMGDVAVLNSSFIGSVFISFAGLFISYQLYGRKDDLRSWEQKFHIPMLIWGLAWWLGAGFADIDEYLPTKYETNIALLFMAISAFVLTITARKLKWTPAEYPATLLLPVMMLIAFVIFIDDPDKNPVWNLGYVAWISAFTVQYFLLWYSEKTWGHKLLANWHAGTMWIYLFMITWIIAQAFDEYLSKAPIWSYIAWGFIPACGVLKLFFIRNRIRWPVQIFKSSYFGPGLAPVIIYLAIWTIISCFNDGNPNPINYFPVINPLDVAQILSMLMIYEWVQRIRTGEIEKFYDINPVYLLYLVSGIVFFWANSLIAHCVHFYTGIDYQLFSLFHSAVFQTSLSVFWTLIAFTLMGLASRLKLRKIWVIGAGLLAAVVIKLFLVDIEDTGTIAQIISFLTVGFLMLIIDYIAPIPPRAMQTN